MVIKGENFPHGPKGLVEAREETWEGVGEDQRGQPFFPTVSQSVFLIPFITGDEKEGRRWWVCALQGSGKNRYFLFTDYFLSISVEFLQRKKKEVKRVITQDSQLGRSQCELSEFVDQVFGLANTGLFSPIPVSFLTLLM